MFYESLKGFIPPGEYNDKVFYFSNFYDIYRLFVKTEIKAD